MHDTHIRVTFDPSPMRPAQVLTRWARCLPHLALAGVATGVGAAVAVGMGVAVTVTGRRPMRPARWQVWAVRERVRCFSYFFLLRPTTPPFPNVGLVDDGNDLPTEVTVDLSPTLPRWSPFVRLAIGLPRIIVGLPLGVLLDGLYPFAVVVAAAHGGWSLETGNALARLEEWVAEVFLYMFFGSDDAPDLFPPLGAHNEHGGSSRRSRSAPAAPMTAPHSSHT